MTNASIWHEKFTILERQLDGYQTYFSFRHYHHAFALCGCPQPAHASMMRFERAAFSRGRAARPRRSPPPPHVIAAGDDGTLSDGHYEDLLFGFLSFSRASYFLSSGLTAYNIILNFKLSRLGALCAGHHTITCRGVAALFPIRRQMLYEFHFLELYSLSVLPSCARRVKSDLVVSYAEPMLSLRRGAFYILQHERSAHFRCSRRQYSRYILMVDCRLSTTFSNMPFERIL